MLNRIGGSCRAKWSRAQKILDSSFYTKTYADRKESLKPMDFLFKYNEQATQQILDVLNKTSADGFARYDISKGRTQKIERYRKIKGPFKTIDQVLEVDDFGAKILEKLVSSIAAGGSKQTVEPDHKSNSKFSSNLTSPTLNNEKRIAIDTVTGIWLGREHISWAKIESSGRLLLWDSQTNFEFPKKDNPMVLHDLAIKIRTRLPASDIYVAEALSTSQRLLTKDPNTVMLRHQYSQLTSMLVTLLATEFDRSNENEAASWTQIDNFYFIQRQLPAQLFHLVIGNETVSARNVINEILNETITKSLEHIPRITIDSQEIHVYHKSDSVKQEALSQALLLSIAFMEVAVKCNPLSLKAIRNKSQSRIY